MVRDGARGRPLQWSNARSSTAKEDARIEAARRILRLEQQKGFNDRAVVGGLDAYIRRTRSEADLPDDPRLNEALKLLGGYGSLSLQLRASRVEQALQVLDQADGAPAAKSSAKGRPPLPDPLPQGGRGQAATHRTPATGMLGATLETPVEGLKGLGKGKERVKALARLGIERVGDFLTHYPTRYIAYPPPDKAHDLFFKPVGSFVGQVRDVQRTQSSPRLKKITATLCDETGCVSAVWFRGGYGDVKLVPGTLVALSGRIVSQGRRLQFEDPDWEVALGEPLHTRRLVPVFPLTRGILDRWMREQVKQAVDQFARHLEEHLPAWVVREQDLLSLPEAIAQIHFPKTEERAERARRRLAFDEMFAIQLLVLKRRAEWQAPGAEPLPRPHTILNAFEASLPFQLTTAQRRVREQVLADLQGTTPMTRLLQGEVGSGKTVVAAASLLPAMAVGAQAALMAPTEILAEQHYRTLVDLYGRAETALEPLLGRGPRVALLTGSTRGREREEVLAGAADGKIDVVVGTHALIQEAVEFRQLALVVVDEQHRFGVRQRVQLRQKGLNPHMLVMTATPIPRTLALTLYGDLDVSIINELPPGRKPVHTELLTPVQASRAYQRIREEVRSGRQAFIICPLIEDSPHLEVKAATEEYERLRLGELAGLRLGLLHGRMRAQDKEQTMRAFRDGDYDVLVSTSVVEVGVDVPNATVMLVEGAERFGLSQLHQFRGRVGRGSEAAVCLLQTSQSNGEARERLEALVESNDGLELAQRDLELRGPGDFFGVRQSGLPDLRMARLSDTDLVEAARGTAERLLKEDPDLTQLEHAALRRQVEQLGSRTTESN